MRISFSTRYTTISYNLILKYFCCLTYSVFFLVNSSFIINQLRNRLIRCRRLDFRQLEKDNFEVNFSLLIKLIDILPFCKTIAASSSVNVSSLLLVFWIAKI